MRMCDKCGFWFPCEECNDKIIKAEEGGYKILEREESTYKITAWVCKDCGKIYKEKEVAIRCCRESFK